ncbi:MAG: septum formation inhibitor Maf [Oscillospiraceae bacterium]|nr:septum formation inhibitor Maf [Oscillospiraceae bacterium]
MNIVLASASPRRRELLEQIGLSFSVRPAASEPSVCGLSPEQTVCAVALAKAEDVALAASPEELILGADTLVYLDGEPLGKPSDTEHAVSMLRRLSGREHDVYTGVALVGGGRKLVRCERTVVRFRPLTEDLIRRYAATGEPLDKAGAYGIQGRGCLLVESIHGDYNNVVGLPLGLLRDMLESFGVPVL